MSGIIDKKILTAYVLTISVMNFANAEVMPTKSEYDKFYQTLQNDMPAQLYGLSSFMSFLGMSLAQVGKFDPKDRINVFDPKFAGCMQTAINQPFYEPTLKQNFDSYLKQASLNDFKNDLAFMTDESTQSNDKLYKNIFADFSKNNNWRVNAKIAESKKKLEKPYTGNLKNLSESYYDLFGEKSSLGKVIANQFQQCQKVQAPIN